MTNGSSKGWPLDGSSWSDSQRCDWDVKEYTALDFCGLLGPYAYLFVVFDVSCFSFLYVISICIVLVAFASRRSFTSTVLLPIG
ncbi:hypothetical protein MANES_14G067066v8 [Manihot esculenta]|uniref:Uncharacterized protein n=1 Tax=Manihot esculenta TaxID=3983 RepID=A0ACB7GFP2_MANES|nr:hypothetical protein MANES_14G067066v8 [Manihot esculenta]